MHEWKPIETAPKDGTAVLLYGPDLPTPVVATLKMHELVRSYPSKGFGRSVTFKWHDTVRGFEVYPPPTHWMPLPSPPKED
jgi:hypothetical protein